MEEELDAIFSSFVFTLLAIKGLKPVADKVGLLDVPNHGLVAQFQSRTAVSQAPISLS